MNYECCLKCGRKRHLVTKCYAKTDINGNKINQSNNISNSRTRVHKNANQSNNKYKKIYANGRWISIPNNKYNPNSKSLTNEKNIDTKQIDNKIELLPKEEISSGILCVIF